MSHLYFQIDLCEMPSLIVNRVIRREPVGLAYLKKFLMSSDLPIIALPALSSMTVNFDASTSSSLHDESSSLPTTPTCVYMRSPDLVMDKTRKKTNTSDSDDQFFSVPQTPELKSQTLFTNKQELESSNNLQDNTNSNYNSTEPQLLNKSKKHVNNLEVEAEQTAFDDVNSKAVSSRNSQIVNITFTTSTGSSDVLSGMDSATSRDTDGITMPSSDHQPP